MANGIDYLKPPAMTLETDLKTGEHQKLLKDKVAIVTGGGKGIGKGISIRLAQAGAKVVIVGNSNMAMAEDTCAQIWELGGEACCLAADLEQPESARKVVDFAVSTYGKLDILVNNAAYQPNRDITEYEGELFKKIIDINLMSYLRMTLCALPYLKESGEGRIINISSVHGKKATGFDIAYATSKGGITMLTRETAVAYAQYGITCNAILPGGTIIEFKTHVADDVREIEGKRNRITRERVFKPQFKPGYPSDTANLAVFLCSELGKHYNGVQVRADGGMVLF